MRLPIIHKELPFRSHDDIQTKGQILDINTHKSGSVLKPPSLLTPMCFLQVIINLWLTISCVSGDMLWGILDVDGDRRLLYMWCVTYLRYGELFDQSIIWIDQFTTREKWKTAEIQLSGEPVTEKPWHMIPFEDTYSPVMVAIIIIVSILIFRVMQMTKRCIMRKK